VTPVETASTQLSSFGAEAPIFEVMQTMRAMRRLKPDPVAPELLEQLVQAATWAPTASNTQAYTFLIVTDRERMRALADPWMACWRFYEHTGVPPESMSRAAFEREMAASRFQAAHFAEIPALIVPCYDMGPWQRQVTFNVRGVARGLSELGWRRSAGLIRNSGRSVSITEAGSVFPGAQNMLLCARTLGLGAVMTTWHLCLEQEFKQILGIPRRVKTFALIPVGWPRGRFGSVSRGSAAEVIRYNGW
jgi:nitroreductase